MIVGTGLLAQAFQSRYANNDEVVIFASGVSNSLESDASAFAKEQTLLTEILASDRRRVVYFGSCGVVNQEELLSPYMQHKQDMERLVTEYPGGLVLRLPQVVGKTSNPNTLTNFIRDRILSGIAFTIWGRAERNLIDIDDIVAIGSVAIDSRTLNSQPINIAADHSILVLEIVDIFERVMQRRANCTIEDKGSALRIDSSQASATAIKLGIDFGHGYAERVIRKYYEPMPTATT